MERKISFLFSDNLVHAIAGAMGSAVAITVFYPLDTARLRLQVDDKRVSKCTPGVVAEILDEEGLKGLYRGWFPAICSLCCSNFVYFYTFNGLKELWLGKRGSSTPGKDIVMGLIAGTVNVLVTTPMWVVNTRLKLQGARFRNTKIKPTSYTGIFDAFRRIVGDEGWGALWNGTLPSLLLVFNPAIQFMVYEGLKRQLGKAKNEFTAVDILIIGALAKAVATTSTYPLQTVQSTLRYGQHGPVKKRGVMRSLKQMVSLLAQRVQRLGSELGKVQMFQEANRETRVQIQQSVRGKDVFIIQTCPRDVNTAVMELLIMTYACRTSSAQNIIGVVPYFPYSKQCKMRKRGSIVCKLLASMLCKAGLSHLITMDLHQKEIQGFFNIPVDNLRASPFLIQYIQEEIPDYRNAVIVAKSPASAKRAQSFAERLRLALAVIHGEAQDAESDMVDGRHSPPPSMPKSSASIHPSLEMPVMIAKEKPPITVVGDVGGRIAIIVDDIIDVVDTFVVAAEILKERGAYKIYVMATHGLLSSDAPRLIEESLIDEVVVTSTIPHEVQKLQCHKIKTVDISSILAEAIRRIHNGESMSYLFRNIGVDD